MSLRSSPLAAAHEAAGASTTDFGGWEMPVEFDTIRAEHGAVRESVGKFDVSHMGEAVVGGPDATGLVQRLTTNDAAALDPGEGHYAGITREDGVLRDDVVVYRLPDPSSDGESEGEGEGGGDDASAVGRAPTPLADGAFLVVPNAGNDAATVERWREYADAEGFDATVSNRTEDLAMIAVQGPDAVDLVRTETSVDLRDLSRFDVAVGPVADVPALIARTGYTGEDGVELVVPWDEAGAVWSALDCRPCGLGARDTLRLEMGFLLSGRDFHPEDEPRNPYEAGIDFVVDLDTEFVGRDALEGVDVEGHDEEIVGVAMIDRGVPRAGYEVTDPDGDPLGTVTSGTMSPTLDRGIALAYLPVEYVEPDRTLRVVVRGEPKKARTVAPPFLDR